MIATVPIGGRAISVCLGLLLGQWHFSSVSFRWPLYDTAASIGGLFVHRLIPCTLPVQFDHRGLGQASPTFVGRAGAFPMSLKPLKPLSTGFPHTRLPRTIVRDRKAGITKEHVNLRPP